MSKNFVSKSNIIVYNYHDIFLKRPASFISIEALCATDQVEQK